MTKKYREIFSSFHTAYRLITTSDNIRNFTVGICRVYKNSFKAVRVVMVCKNVESHSFMKVCLENKKQYVKKGGASILTKREKDILNQEREMLLNNRLIYPFIFVNNLGAIYVKRRQKIGEFSDLEKRWFLSLSEEVTTHLKIYNLMKEGQKLMINYLNSLSNILDRYVPTSYLHTKSTLRLIKALSHALKLSDTEVKSLEYASLLHDAGKIQVPSKILKKRKPLTEDEFKLIMKHPRKGVDLIKNLEVLKPVLPIILHHHERYDGTGYPSKLKKDKIPFGSRILAILDAFDAMYFGRPYKKRRSLEDIEQEFRSEMNKQFDPKIVTIFLKILKRKDIKKFLKSCG